MHKLAYEGGNKNLYLFQDENLDSLDCILLAGKIAYDLSFWHELSTWFGASAVPMIPERYSSFSVEDVYSNLLGVMIGMQAVKSDLPYDEAMTKILGLTLGNLGAVKDEKDTYAALEAVRDVWWTREKRLPSQKVLIERDTETFTHCSPWLIPTLAYANADPAVLDVPLTASNGQPLTRYYQLSIELNHKFPVKELFPDRETRWITQNDFGVLLNRMELDLMNNDHTVYLNSKKSTDEPGRSHL
jgi:hypothetical protein